MNNISRLEEYCKVLGLKDFLIIAILYLSNFLRLLKILCSLRMPPLRILRCLLIGNILFYTIYNLLKFYRTAKYPGQ